MTPHVFLSGPMGSGKTTVGRLVARALDRPFVDLDRRVEERAGLTIRELFEARGEAAFRELEQELARELCAHEAPMVCALGGGTVADTGTRALVLSRGLVVTLAAPAAELARRTASDTVRPLLTGDSSERERRLAALLEARASAYAEAHAVLDTGGASPDQVASRVMRLLETPPVLVRLGPTSYRAHLGRLEDHLATLVAARAPTSVLVVTDENAAPHAARAAASLEGLALTTAVLASGEQHKTLAAVERVWDEALAAGVDRGSLVLAVGGGVVGDVAGFAAATLLRGIAVAHVPTTLLAMVDSAIGGKTGIDRPEGKNLVGAFHSPRFVMVDPSTLETLPDRELRAGLAEVVKSAWLRGEHAVAALERDAAALVAREPAALERAIRMSLSLKAAIVSADPLERGVRAHLNLGHTVGHALESASGYTLRHGEAVALGLVAAMRVGRTLEDASPTDVDRMTALLAGLGLPTDVDARLDSSLEPLLRADKKRSGARIGFVVPGAPGQVRVAPLSPEAILAGARANLVIPPG